MGVDNESRDHTERIRAARARRIAQQRAEAGVPNRTIDVAQQSRIDGRPVPVTTQNQSQ
jgi:hypothetical protein